MLACVFYLEGRKAMATMRRQLEFLERHQAAGAASSRFKLAVSRLKAYVVSSNVQLVRLAVISLILRTWPLLRKQAPAYWVPLSSCLLSLSCLAGMHTLAQTESAQHVRSAPAAASSSTTATSVSPDPVVSGSSSSSHG
jgi:hypothetical protein